jgi:hypothetical protein
MGRTAQQMTEMLRKDQTACPICGFVGAQIRSYIDAVFYDQITDVDVRARMREAGGFCRYHARLVSEQRDALGTALVMHDIIINRLRAMRSADGKTNGLGGLGRLLQGSRKTERAPCPFCEAEREMNALAADSLMRGLAENGDFAVAFEASLGLCIPHFDLAEVMYRSHPSWPHLAEVQTRGLEDLAARLDVLAQSYDHNKRHTVQDADVTSWRQGLNATSGRYD